MNIHQLIQLSRIESERDVELWNEFREEAFRAAEDIYVDRAPSYNIDHSPTEEMPYGPVSLASEMYKRMIRMSALVSPLRVSDLTESDISRLEDTCLDLMNYSSWMWALLQLVIYRQNLTKEVNKSVFTPERVPEPPNPPDPTPPKPEENDNVAWEAVERASRPHPTSYKPLTGLGVIGSGATFREAADSAVQGVAQRPTQRVANPDGTIRDHPYVYHASFGDLCGYMEKGERCLRPPEEHSQF